QSGYAEDCKSFQGGSTPPRASNCCKRLDYRGVFLWRLVTLPAARLRAPADAQPALHRNTGSLIRRSRHPDAQAAGAPRAPPHGRAGRARWAQQQCRRFTASAQSHKQPDSSHPMTAEMPPRTLPESELIPSTLKFPVVGIGASAGGLTPLLTFFEKMPADAGM